MSDKSCNFRMKLHFLHQTCHDLTWFIFSAAVKGLSDRLKPVCLILVPNLWMQTWQQSSLPVSLLPMQWNHLQISWHWKIEGIETLPELRTWERDQQSYKLAAKMVSFIRILNKTWNHKYFPWDFCSLTLTMPFEIVIL